MARPSKFNDSLREKMLELYAKGKTDKQVAEIIGVCEKTLNNWKGKHPSFLQSLKESKQVADELVEASLFSRAVGYSHPSEQIFCTKSGRIVRAKTTKQYPPDTNAGKFWLMNRDPKRWREKIELSVNPLAKKSDDELDKRIEELITKTKPKEGK